MYVYIIISYGEIPIEAHMAVIKKLKTQKQLSAVVCCNNYFICENLYKAWQ